MNSIKYPTQVTGITVARCRLAGGNADQRTAGAVMTGSAARMGSGVNQGIGMTTAAVTGAYGRHNTAVVRCCGVD